MQFQSLNKHINFSRWDQRLYALVLRMAGTPPMSQETGHVASDYSPIDMMCEV